MTRGSFKTLLKQVTNTRDELERTRLRFEEMTKICDQEERRKLRIEKMIAENLRKRDMQDDYFLWVVLISLDITRFDLRHLHWLIDHYADAMARLYGQIMISLISKEGRRACIGGRRVADAIVVSTVILLTFVYHYLVGYIDRGGSKAGSSGPLDFRDIYISIVLFQAAYVWIKFRDVIPRIPSGALYKKPRSSKWEVRILFPVTRGVGGKLKRIPLRSYNSIAEGEIVYRIAAFYCNKLEFTGQLDLGGGAYFHIPALSVDPNRPYKEQVKQVGDKVLNVYAEFVKQKASTLNLPPSVPGLALEMSSGEGQLLTTSPIQQLQQPLTSGMDSVMQGQGSQLASNIHNGVDFNNLDSVLPEFAKTQHELLEARKEIEGLKARVSQTEVESMGWEVKCSELERKNSELERKYSEVERELLNIQVMLSQRQTLHEDQEFDITEFLNMEHEESMAC